MRDSTTRRDKTGRARGKGAGGLQTGAKALTTVGREAEKVVPDTNGF
jgi:hypothetical protein